MKSRETTASSAIRKSRKDRGSRELNNFTELHRRDENDPMKLYQRVLRKLDNYFLIRGLTYLFGQRDLLAHAVEAVLQGNPGTITAIPFQPGIGKSTLIRAILNVFSEEFRDCTAIAEKVGGVIVVVEKTAEADELEQLCNTYARDGPIARAISSPNDYNLAQGKCLNGKASSYEECSGRSCADYAECPLIQSTYLIHDTPILIMLHARYQRYMEDMTPFLTWEDSEACEHTRTLLLVDELPPLIEDNALDLSTLNHMESVFAQFKPSYQTQSRTEKAALLFEWNRSIRTPFFKLINALRKYPGMYGVVSQEEFKNAGFTKGRLQKLRRSIAEYMGTVNHSSIHLIDALLSSGSAYYAVGQDISLFFPRIRKINGTAQPATFLFSGTAILSPELSKNPDILSFPDQNLESFQRLQINIQRGDLFSSSKSGLSKKQNQSALIAWLEFILPQVRQRHSKILVVTYKNYSVSLWHALQNFHDDLIPYIGSNGQPQPLLPYFGGLNGSNLYRESTCVICLGLNRFEPKDYITRALALDFDGSSRSEISAALEAEEKFQLDCAPCVMDMQDITLAREVVQLVFRSALRNHGEAQPIELWLLQPPNGVISHLKSYFEDCQVCEFKELPDNCRLAVAVSREYMGSQTHAGKLLAFLMQWDGQEPLTPAQIRDAIGLSLPQFKEAKKNKEVQRFFAEHITPVGSGKNTVYYKKAA